MKKSYKIFYFCYEGFSKLGNINNHIKETVTWMAKFGHKVHFFNPKITNPKFVGNVKIHLIPIIKISVFKWVSFDIFSFIALIFEYFRNKPDFLYFRETSSLTPLVFSKLFSVPLVVEINGWILQELEESGYAKYKIKYIEHIQRLNYKHADKLIPVSDGLKDLIIKEHQINSDKIKVIENGTNPNKFIPSSKHKARKILKLPKTKKIIGFIGSCYHYHGIQYLIHAAKILVDKYSDIFFVIAGDGEERKNWMLLVEKLSLSNFFYFPGRVPFSEAPNYINSYDICVAPWNIDKLKYNSLSPMKLFDYLSCGKPVVCSPISNIQTLLHNNKCGMIVDVKNAHEFANSISFLIENPQKASEMGMNGRQLIIEHFTWEITTEKILNVVNEL